MKLCIRWIRTQSMRLNNRHSINTIATWPKENRTFKNKQPPTSNNKQMLFANKRNHNLSSLIKPLWATIIEMTHPKECQRLLFLTMMDRTKWFHQVTEPISVVLRAIMRRSVALMEDMTKPLNSTKGLILANQWIASIPDHSLPHHSSTLLGHMKCPSCTTKKHLMSISNHQRFQMRSLVPQAKDLIPAGRACKLQCPKGKAQ
jgi:hypothetical protein